MNGILSGAVAAGILLVAVALIYRIATGINPWPLFVIAELPVAVVSFVILALTAPKRQ